MKVSVKRTNTMAAFMDYASYTLFGRKLSECIANNMCVSCGSDVAEDSFPDALHRKEYEISGLCPKCQDNTFDTLPE